MEEKFFYRIFNVCAYAVFDFKKKIDIPKNVFLTITCGTLFSDKKYI